MTRRLVLCLVALMLAGAVGAAQAPITPTPAAYALAYRGAVGQVAVYRLTLTAKGEQTSLGERRPVRLEAEYEVRERLLSVEADGSFWLEASSHLLRAKDPAHLLNGNGEPGPQRMRLSPRGEVLEVAPSAEAPGLRARAATSLLGQPQLVVLPEGPMEAGAAWDWSKEGMTQTNRLLAVRGGVAQVRSVGRGPVSLHDRSAALGLSTDLQGTVEQTSTLDLEVATGKALRHRGSTELRTTTEIGMETPEGPRAFRAELRLSLTFDDRLLRVEAPPRPSGPAAAEGR